MADEVVLRKETECFKYAIEEANKVIVPATMLGYYNDKIWPLPSVTMPAIMSSCLDAGGVEEYKANLSGFL